MMCGITGTPGTGKTKVADELARRGNTVVHLITTIGPYVTGIDERRDTQIIDVDRWSAGFRKIDGFVEGHIAHLLPCDRIVVLRCRPDELRRRLQLRKYRKEKIDENAEAEALDVCLIETVERFDPSQILELDTTSQDASHCATLIDLFAKGEIPSAFGTIDWSGYLGAS
ncbi:MAG: putative kinase [Methanoregula sp. PtaU1.Bin051]|nr:MAG: putative kinase [Methanoregula sp. PtaU1.Bin051]